MTELARSEWLLMSPSARFLSTGEGSSASDEEDSEIVGSAEVKDLEQDPELQENLDEEKEGEKLAQVMLSEEDSSEDDDEAEKEEGESVSVMNQVIDADVFLERETFVDTPKQPRPEPRQMEDPTPAVEEAVTELSSDRRRKLFWEYMENPNKKK